MPTINTDNLEQGSSLSVTRRVPVTRRAALTTIAASATGAALAACAAGKNGSSAENKALAAAPSPKFTFSPALESTAANPIDPVAISVENGFLNPDIKLTNASGIVVPGQLSEDRKKFTITTELGYGVTYTWSGSAVSIDLKTSKIAGSFTVVKPEMLINVVVNIADGQEVGIAAPLILKFDGSFGPEARKAVERAVTLTTTPATEGGWAWLGDDNGSRLHWRSKEYLEPGTKISMQAKFYGLKMGETAYGAADVTSDYVVGRSQIVKADANSHQMVVVTNGAVSMSFPCSYGEGDVDRNVTRSGIHVVTEKHERFYMSNPAAGYFNLLEQFAVRISNNGEFIHANPSTVGVQGAANVTNGCINLSLANAQTYFYTAMYGDPVEVTGTRIQLSEADGDLYDWVFDWTTWQSMSALVNEPKEPKKAPATPPGAPILSGTQTSTKPEKPRG